LSPPILAEITAVKNGVDPRQVAMEMHSGGLSPSAN